MGGGIKERYSDRGKRIQASLEANPDEGTVSAAYAKLLIDDKSILRDYLNMPELRNMTALVPRSRRCTSEAARLLQQSLQRLPWQRGRRRPDTRSIEDQRFPPSGLNITSQADLANKQADAINTRIASDLSSSFGIR